jgi:hypothetical protein
MLLRSQTLLHTLYSSWTIHPKSFVRVVAGINLLINLTKQGTAVPIKHVGRALKVDAVSHWATLIPIRARFAVVYGDLQLPYDSPDGLNADGLALSLLSNKRTLLYGPVKDLPKPSMVCSPPTLSLVADRSC